MGGIPAVHFVRIYFIDRSLPGTNTSTELKKLMQHTQINQPHGGLRRFEVCELPKEEICDSSASDGLDLCQELIEAIAI